MEGPTPEHLLQIGTGFWASKVLLSAVELELFTDTRRTPGDPRRHQHAASACIHAPRATSSTPSSLSTSSSAATGTTPTRRPPISSSTRSKPSYIGGMLEMANARLYRFWGNLTTALRTGEPQNEARNGGEDPFKLSTPTPIASATSSAP